MFRKIALAFVFMFFCIPAQAQNLASAFSHGPTIPFYVVSFDSAGSATSGLLSAGAGYSLNFNFMPNDTGQWRMLNIGVPIFVNIPNGDTFDMSFGATLGTFNNLVAAGFAVDLIHAGPGPDTGIFVGDTHKQNFKILLAFGFNFGGGDANPMTARAGKFLGEFYEPAPPPGYVRLGGK